jgi:hypothetical protein
VLRIETQGLKNKVVKTQGLKRYLTLKIIIKLKITERKKMFFSFGKGIQFLNFVNHFSRLSFSFSNCQTITESLLDHHRVTTRPSLKHPKPLLSHSQTTTESPLDHYQTTTRPPSATARPPTDLILNTAKTQIIRWIFLIILN